MDYTNGPLTDEWDVFVEWCEENDIDPASYEGEHVWNEWPEYLQE
jgi:hypothetical protein